MKYPLRTVAVLLIMLVVAPLGNSCAYGPDEDVFVRKTDPDAPYAKYAAGRLGIVQSTYRIRHLVIAYNTLSGRGLSPGEQASAETAENYYTAYPAQTPGHADQTWGPVAGSNERAVPGQNWETFTNCLADAFNNASATLADRRARYGKPGAADTPEIADWIAGQRAVFSNCSGQGQVPQPAGANAPLWLRQDRAYQTAATQFYALDYDAALAGFRVIAGDRASPWAPLARYLVARVLIREALVPSGRLSPEINQGKDENARIRATLTQAQAQLEGILRDPSMKPLYGQSRRLLDFVSLRLDPLEQASELARRLTVAKPSDDPDYFQNVIDLTFIYNSLPGYTPWLDSIDAQAKLKAHPPAPLIRWLDDLGWGLPGIRSTTRAVPPASATLARRADALSAWQSTRGPEWLVAALTLSAAGQQSSAELIAAARNLSGISPAYASATYHRLRLAVSSTSLPVYHELSQLMPRMAESQPLSTVNQFADLQSSLSPTLEDYLQNATRSTAGLVNPVASLPAKNVALCNVDIYAPETRHLSDQTALIFNQRMPLRLLKEAALSSALPANVRFTVAHMAWTRALLLGDAETAKSLAPYLTQCQPAFSDWLNRYNAATPAERRALGLLALMRFASTEPTLRAGIERDFAAYSDIRDNWWCSYDPMTQAGPAADKATHLFNSVLVAPAAQTDPPFLTAADRAEARLEIARLQKIPGASDYFAQQALAWVTDHPNDEQDAEVIGFAMRVVRNACRSANTGDLHHQLFDILHRRFPNSEWASRYTTWE